MAKILSKFAEQQLFMVNGDFNQSETGKYFELIIIHLQWPHITNVIETPWEKDTVLLSINMKGVPFLFKLYTKG